MRKDQGNCDPKYGFVKRREAVVTDEVVQAGRAMMGPIYGGEIQLPEDKEYLGVESEGVLERDSGLACVSTTVRPQH